MARQRVAVLYALLAAACYGMSIPLSKLLLGGLPPVLLASLLYLGAGLGMGALMAIRRLRGGQRLEARLSRRELPYIVGMIVLDIAAPVCLLFGLAIANPSEASLLNNFEIVTTAMLARLLFRERIGKRLWVAISLITVSTILLTLETENRFSLSAGSVLVLLACVCWGLENNCTRMLSIKDPLEIVTIKGFGSGLGSLAIALCTGAYPMRNAYIPLALLLGAVAYGASIWLYVLAQRWLGAARTSAYYAIAPFVGVAVSFALFQRSPEPRFWWSLSIMTLGVLLAILERHAHAHRHEALTHEHRHSHEDGHHLHTHEGSGVEHSHVHAHEPLTHAHPHSPDAHHIHVHRGE